MTSLQEGNRQNSIFDLILRSDEMPFMGTFRIQVFTQNKPTLTSYPVSFQATEDEIKQAIEAVGMVVGLVDVKKNTAAFSLPRRTYVCTWQVTFLTVNDPTLKLELVYNDGSGIATCEDCIAPTYPYTMSATDEPQMQVVPQHVSDQAFGGHFQVEFESRSSAFLTLDPSNGLEDALNELLQKTHRMSVRCTRKSPQAVAWLITFLTSHPTPSLTMNPSKLIGSGITFAISTVQESIVGEKGDVPLMTISSSASLAFSHALNQMITITTLQNGSLAAETPFQMFYCALNSC